METQSERTRSGLSLSPGRGLLLLLGAGTAGFLLLLFAGRGTILEQILYHNNDAYFFDFYNCLYWLRAGAVPWEAAAYPPLANLLLYGFSHLLPMELINMGEDAIRASQQGVLILYLYLAIPLSGSALLLARMKRGRAWEKALLAAAFLLCRPLLFAFDRGNILPYALFFCLAFLAGKDDERSWVRELSLICLALSAGIKLYPALLGLLLVKEKRWKESARLLAYGLAAFFLPSLIFYGWAGPENALGNLLFSVNLFSRISPFYTVSLENALIVTYPALSATAASVLSYVLAAGAVGAFFLSRSRWKSMFLLTMASALLLFSAQYYNVLFAVIPLLYFLDREEPFRWTDLLYGAGFFLLLTPMVVWGKLDYPFMMLVLPSLLLFILTVEELLRWVLRLGAKEKRPGNRDAIS